MPTSLTVDADLDFSVELPGGKDLAGRLRGAGQQLQLRVDAPEAFAGRADSAAVRAMADRLAALGLTLTVVAEQRALVTLGVRRNSWLQRRLTGSRHMRVEAPRGAWTAVRGRARRGDAPVLPDGSLLPPGTLTPLAPTFLRRPRRPTTTTHDPAEGGQPRLVLAPREDSWTGERQPWFHLRVEGTTTIGSSPSCDVRLSGLGALHAEVRHDERDEFVVESRDPETPVLVNGERVRSRILRTGSRVDVGGWTLTYFREEYADHGRPYGGRIGGELGHQRPQPPRHRASPGGQGGR